MTECDRLFLFTQRRTSRSVGLHSYSYLLSLEVLGCLFELEIVFLKANSNTAIFSDILFILTLVLETETVVFLQIVFPLLPPATSPWFALELPFRR